MNSYNLCQENTGLKCEPVYPHRWCITSYPDCPDWCPSKSLT